MKIHRFFGSAIDNFIVNPDLVHQIKNVLKLKKGEQLALIDESEKLFVIDSIGSQKIALSPIKELVTNNANAPKVILYCSIIKKDNFELVVQKATEIGVTKIVPLICDRTIKTNLNFARLEKIAMEASEQSGRPDKPQIAKTLSFEQAIADADNNDVNFFCDKSGLPMTINKKTKSIGLFIGPEGGFTDAEIQKATSSKLKLTSLCKNVLRAETAAICACYQAINL